MEPRIQYTTTSDGVSIAYHSTGSGPAYVWMPMPPQTHIQLLWEIADMRSTYDLITRAYTLVRYDPRGFGLSERQIADFSLDAMVADVEAVVDQLGVQSIRLAASDFATPIAIAYAARCPDRVSHLVLDSPVARGAEGLSPSIEALVDIAESQWDFVTQAMVHEYFWWAQTDAVPPRVEILRQASSPQNFVAFMRQVREWDTSDLLPRIKAQTLITHDPQNRHISVETVQKMAAHIPNAQLFVATESGPVASYRERTTRVVGSFLAKDRQPRGTPARLPSGTAIILFADIADSTALTERLGDAAFRDKARELDAALRRAISSKGGTAIEGKLLGDGVLATFGSAREAIECAARCHNSADASGLRLHVGIHAGDVIRESNNVFGGAVNIAARVASEAGAGETLVSQTVRDLARTSAGVSFEDRGERELKGVGDSVRVWAVREQG